ncbi:HNH endonuclease [Streptomyces sp. NBC_00879]|uniref:HNH endonuclease n=1 Tax=Streptomyces sp. NBC_00879 TaxID=2975855 RepID=UPI00386F1DB0|nr:HNH endonuclease [Streptomyces sp. NBC_00879]
MARCIECAETATHRGRCEGHHQVYERRAPVRARRVRRAVLVRVHSGAARLRALVGARGGARCARCGSLVLADVVDVDHVRPLSLGGEDTDGNVQPLCRGCHLVKTREDFGVQAPPF